MTPVLLECLRNFSSAGQKGIFIYKLQRTLLPGSADSVDHVTSLSTYKMTPTTNFCLESFNVMNSLCECLPFHSSVPPYFNSFRYSAIIAVEHQKTLKHSGILTNKD